MPSVEDTFSVLSNSNRKERKSSLSNAVECLKTASVCLQLHQRSEEKARGESKMGRGFTWKSVADIVLHILSEEIYAQRRLKSASTASLEVSECFRLLNIFLSTGLKTNLEMPTTELLDGLLRFMKESNENSGFLQSALVDSLSILLSHAPLMHHSFKKSSVLSLLEWSFKEMQAAPSGPVGLILCQTISISASTHPLLLRALPSLTEIVLTHFSTGVGLDLCGLGWYLRLLRWSLCSLPLNSLSIQKLIQSFQHHAPGLFRLWSKFRDPHKIITPPIDNLDSLSYDSSFFCTSVELMKKFVESIDDPFAMDQLFIGPRMPLLDRIFNLPKLQTSDVPIASPIHNNTDSCLLYTNSYLFVDERPDLVPQHFASTNRLHANRIGVGRELLNLSRWLLFVAPLASFSLSETFITLLVNFYVIEWRKIVDRMRFQVEETLVGQLPALWDFFGTFAAVIVVARPVDKFSKDLLEPLVALCKQRTGTLLFSQDSSPSAIVSKFISMDESEGLLWWPVLDWVIRFQWQTAIAAGKRGYVECADILQSIGSVIKSAKRELAIECALSAASTALTVVDDYIKRFDMDTKLLDRVSARDEIWKQSIQWLEQLSLVSKRESSTSVAHIFGNPRRALLADRLICDLISKLLSQAYQPTLMYLTRLWTILSAPHPPAFASHDMGDVFRISSWRYRLAVSVYLLHPQQILGITANTRLLPPPLAMLMYPTTQHNLFILQFAHLQWSLPLMTSLDGSTKSPIGLPPALPAAEMFGGKRVAAIRADVYARLAESFRQEKESWSYSQVLFNSDAASMQAIVLDLGRRKSSDNWPLAVLIIRWLAKLPQNEWPKGVETMVVFFLRGSVTQISFELNDASRVPVTLSLCNEVEVIESDYDEAQVLPLILTPLVSIPSLLRMSISEVISHCNWRLCEDVVWLVTLTEALYKVIKQNSQKVTEGDEEEFADIFCCLFDAFRDGFRHQLVSKRWDLVLRLLNATHSFARALLIEFQTIGRSEEDVWKQISSQIIRLIETVWTASKTEMMVNTSFLAPIIFSESVDIWLKFHSLNLVKDTVIDLPYETFLSFSNPSFCLNLTKTLITGLLDEMEPARVGLASLSLLLSHFLGKMIKGDEDTATVRNDSFTFYLLNGLLEVIVVALRHQYETSPLIMGKDNLLVSVCTLVSRLLVKFSPRSLHHVLVDRLANGDETYFDRCLRPVLFPMCLCELSNGSFDGGDFDDANSGAARLTAVWGYQSFSEYLQLHSDEFAAFQMLAGEGGLPTLSAPSSSLRIHQTAAALFDETILHRLVTQFREKDQDFVKELLTPDAIVSIIFNLANFLLLFASDEFVNIDDKAASLSHRIVSRLTLLLLELFGNSLTDGAIIRLLESANDQQIFRLLDQFVRLDDSHLLSLVDRCLEKGSEFLKDPRHDLSTGAVDVLGGKYCRLFIWVGITRFLALLILSHRCQVDSRLQEFTLWRLVMGLVELIDAEYLRDGLIKARFLVTALGDIFRLIADSTQKPCDQQLENAYHNASVYLLLEMESKVQLNSSQTLNELSSKIETALDCMLLAKRKDGVFRFGEAICVLDNLPPSLKLSAKYTLVFDKCCVCDRNSFASEIGRFLSTLGKSATLRCPRLVRYRSVGFGQLITLIGRSSGSGVATAPQDLHLRLAMKPILLADTRAAEAAEARFQNWVPPDERETRYSIDGPLDLKQLLLECLSPSADEVECATILLDPKTRESMTTCLSTLQVFYSDTQKSEKHKKYSKNMASEYIAAFFRDTSTPNPLHVEQLSVVLHIAQKIADPHSVIACLAPSCLRNLFSSSFDLFSDSIIDVDAIDKQTSLLTMLAPFLDVRVLVSSVTSSRRRPANTKNAQQFFVKFLSTRAADALTVDHLNQLGASFQTGVDSSYQKMIDWLFTNDLVLDAFFSNFEPLLRSEVTFQQLCVPWILSLLVIHLRLASASSSKRQTDTPFDNLVTFLNSLLSASLPTANETSGPVEVVLKTLMVLHRFTQWFIKIGIVPNFYWNFDWFAAAQHSLCARRPTDARFFFELAWINQQQDLFLSKEGQMLWIDLCRSQRDVAGLKAAQTSMEHIFSNPDPATINNGTTCMSLEESMRFAIHEAEEDNRWMLTWVDKQLGDNISGDNSALALHLHRLGVDNAFSRLSQNIDSRCVSPQLSEARYRVAWRLSQWSHEEPDKTESTSNSSAQFHPLDIVFESALTNDGHWEELAFHLNRAVARQDWQQISSLVEKKRLRSIFCHPVLGGRIGSLLTWKRVADMLADDGESVYSPVLYILNNVLAQCPASEMQCPLVETSLRFAEALAAEHSDEILLLLIRQFQLALAESMLLERGDVLNARRIFETLSYSLNTCLTTSLEQVRFELCRGLVKARIERAEGDVLLANCRLMCDLKRTSNAIDQLSNTGDDGCIILESYLSATVSLCSWLAESRTKSWADLITQHLKPALDLVEKWPSKSIVNGNFRATNIEGSRIVGLQRLHADALATLAEFADAQFKTFDGYIRSPEFATRRRLLADADADAACLTEVDRKSRFLRILQRQTNLEAVELTNLFSGIQSYFSTALTSYCRCLALGDKYDLKIYRLVSLWFSATSQVGLSGDEDSSSNLFTSNWLTDFEILLMEIRVDKFLPLFPQLLVRLTTNLTSEASPLPAHHVAFQSILRKLIMRLMLGHPHHTGFALLSLVNADADETPTSSAVISTMTMTNSRSKRQKVEKPAVAETTGDSRKAMATVLFSELCHSIGSNRPNVFAQMQALATAYIEWANVDVEGKRNAKGDIPLPTSIKLWRLSREAEIALSEVAMPTCPPRVSSCEGAYSRFVHVVGFAPVYRLAGGLNLPKIITCLCSDGRSRQQLIKGRDDPRQDAIMQQVFSAANHLLANFTSQPTISSKAIRATAARRQKRMRIRTYMVIPLARKSGLIEWCEGTVPLGKWLAAEEGGAHQRYRPTDLTPTQAKLKLAGVRDKPLERRFAIFNEVCAKMHPVFGYFFVENFPNPSAWYEARMCYTASLAVSSILGYLVGLGDRHPHNLLLHPATGEVVHIDLGIAFDQGRLLPTPELVPFRLTRDLVHALGPLGLEAGFTGVAESALSAFATGSDIFITLLEVLLHDPLYTWSLTPAQLCALEAKRAEAMAAIAVETSRFCPGGDTCRGTNASYYHPSSTLMCTGINVNTARKLKESVNQLAERVLLTVRDKLAGRVGGIGGGGLSTAAGSEGIASLGTAGHVNLLVRAATNPENLSRMYFGWQAYL